MECLFGTQAWTKSAVMQLIQFCYNHLNTIYERHLWILGDHSRHFGVSVLGKSVTLNIKRPFVMPVFCSILNATKAFRWTFILKSECQQLKFIDIIVYAASISNSEIIRSEQQPSNIQQVWFFPLSNNWLRWEWIFNAIQCYLEETFNLMDMM